MPNPAGRILAADPTPHADLGCAATDCPHPPDPAAPVPLCESHLRTAFAYYLAHAEEHAAAPLPDLDLTPDAVGERHGWVYFMRFGDLIKIGWSRTVDRRIVQLQPDALLHHEPGSRADERRLHLQFEHLNARDPRSTELFRAGPDLLRYIRLHHSGVAA